jgi:hypothetical protein
MADSLPPWDHDPLSTLMSDADHNERACALNYPDVYEVLKAAHGLLKQIGEILEKDPDDVHLGVPRLLIARSHSAVLAAVRLAMSGQGSRAPQRLHRVGSPRHLEPRGLECAEQGSPDRRVVLDEEHPRSLRGHHVPPRGVRRAQPPGRRRRTAPSASVSIPPPARACSSARGRRTRRSGTRSPGASRGTRAAGGSARWAAGGPGRGRRGRQTSAQPLRDPFVALALAIVLTQSFRSRSPSR